MEVRVMNEMEPLPRIPDSRPLQRPVGQGVSASAGVRPAAVPAGANDQAGADSAQATARKAPEPLNPKAVEQALQQLTQFAQNFQRSLQFSVDSASGETVVRVLDANTKEVIRQIPSEEFLAIAERLRQESKASSGVLMQASV